MPDSPPKPASPGLYQRIRNSIFPSMSQMADPGTRQGYRRFFGSLLLHFRPRTVPAATLRFTLTWGLGGMALVLVLMTMGTGVLLKFFYQPFPEKAYDSVLFLQNEVAFGPWIRSIHHWAANALLVVAFLHLLRVFFTGAFHPPRQFNWVIGLGLFLIVVLSNFTGYLLPWDQLAYWAITICTGMLGYLPGAGPALQRLVQGGSEMGPATLANFYAVHTAVLPALLLVLMPFHFWRVRKAGGLVVPRGPGDKPEPRVPLVPSIPDLLLREITVALVLVAAVLVFAIFVEAPLAGKANPGLSPNPTKAPWYFLGIQETLMHFHPLFALVVIPMMAAMALLGLPYLRYPSDTAGVWFASAAGRRLSLAAVAAGAIVTPLAIVADEHLVELTRLLPGVPAAITNGLLPFGVLVAGIWGYCTLSRRAQPACGRQDTVQMIFVLLLVAFLVLTVTGIFFRGPGMRLQWP